jgi:hypothetical protein
MLDPSQPSPIWVVWPYLSWLERLLFVALVVLGIYVCSSAAFTILRVRKTVASLRNAGSLDAKQVFAALHRRSASVDRLITTAFYLFGIVLSLGLQGAYFIVDNSKAMPERLILRNFQSHFAFAANVFFVLLVLQIIAWFISRFVGRLALQLVARQVE